MEEIRQIFGWPNYGVSNMGAVYRRTERGIKALSLETLKDGYPCVSLYHNGRKKFAYVHKLVAEAFLGEAKKGEIVLHLNDVKTDNRVENLRYGSRQENTDHMKAPFWRRNAQNNQVLR